MTHPVTHTPIDHGWVEAYEAEAARLARDGIYLPETKHASCGVGLVAAQETFERELYVIRRRIEKAVV